MNPKGDFCSVDLTQYGQFYLDKNKHRFARMVHDVSLLGVNNTIALDVAGIQGEQNPLVKSGIFKRVDVLGDFDCERDEWSARSDSLYDVVVMTEVIEHLSDHPAHALVQCNKSLKKGGFLYLTTQNIAKLKSIYALTKGLTPYNFGGYYPDTDDIRHHREYTLKELARFVAAHGFKLVAYTTDCFEYYAYDDEWVSELDNLQLDMRFHGHDNVIMARKIEEVTDCVMMPPIYTHHVAKEYDFEKIGKKIKFVDYFRHVSQIPE
ncbi:methyltransferase domain-containing protein [Pseudodesulfovibrio senegalensis]|uniref:Class I SAM-dependent methyltransferase n=1 Tax=Pseudodesulfovibrio senegalensis TaxID=1721087 RepID=A0A6N6N1N7_9BACT|nr:methyltransferase domain-containing protein [Pseudodesulfovibrio senegalensis]KAB1441440.1 class I SAM-dependent methyltransferase [Pseudodesulfovibrio senegalensis]